MIRLWPNLKKKLFVGKKKKKTLTIFIERCDGLDTIIAKRA